MLGDPRIADAVVVRKPDDRWGEVPVAFIASNDPTLEAEDLEAIGTRRIELAVLEVSTRG